VRQAEIVLTDGSVIPYGLCIWSTGVGPTPFTKSLPFASTKMGRIAIDDHCRVLAHKMTDSTGAVLPPRAPHAPPGLLTQEQQAASSDGLEVVPDVFSLGDCAANVKSPLPPVAQVAEQHGKYCAALLNRLAREPEALKSVAAFQYHHLGSMASVGNYDALLQLSTRTGGSAHIKGWLGWLSWRSAYLTRLGSIQKRLSVAFSWTITLIFGRDMSRW
jgi:NADH:ubiquinone reductase (non-electrogenic)